MIETNIEQIKDSECDPLNVLNEQSQLQRPLRCSVKWKILLKNITVEPLAFCYLFPMMLSDLAGQNMDMEKACRVNLNFSSIVCDDMMNLRLENITQEVIDVQTIVAKMKAWVIPIGTAVPAFLMLYIGAWSDRNHNRKLCMVIPLVGAILSKVALLIGVYYFMELPLEYNAISQTIIGTATGGRVIFFMGCYAYITDITSSEERTFRIGLLNLFMTLAVCAGVALSGILTIKIGYYGVFISACFIYTIGFVYAFFRIDELHIPKVNNVKTSVCNFFAVYHIMDTLRVAFKKRNGSKRTILILSFFLSIIVLGSICGEFQMMYMYTIKKFSFTAVDFGMFMSLWMLIGALGTLFTITVFSKIWRFDDALIGVLSAVSGFFSSQVFAFSPTWQWFYFGTLVDFCGKVSGTNIRSITTKIVNADEVGKMTSIIGVLEALAPVIFMPLYSLVYTSTVRFLPGAFYLLSSGFFLLAGIVFSIVYVLGRKDKKSQEENLNLKPV